MPRSQLAFELSSQKNAASEQSSVLESLKNPVTVASPNLMPLK